MTSPRPVEIVRAETGAHVALARTLVREYAGGLGVDLCFQDLEAEMQALGTVYAPPHGALRLAFVDGEAAGCVAVRARADAGDGTCEMKRLYVRPAFRGLDLGRRLAEAVLADARRLGYRRMVLDTLETMQAARGLYAALGFRDAAPYYDNPLDGVRYLEADL